MNSDPFHAGRYSRFINYVALPLHSKIRGKKYASLRRFVEESQWWTREKLEEFQFEELRKVLRIAFESVPFYQRKYAEAGLQYKDIQSPSDIRRLPALERDDVKRFKNELCSTTYHGKLLPHATGGSTGTPVQFFRTPESYDWRTAVTARSYAWAGAMLGERILYLWGGATGRPPLWQRLKLKTYHWVRNEIVIDSFHRSGDFWPEVVRMIRSIRPTAIVSYASNIEELCLFARERGLTFSGIRGVVAAAEPVYPDLYKSVQEVLGCQLFNSYGSREFMSIAVECGSGGFHINMENIFIESTDEGVSSDLLVTDLHNYGMPFIRYRVGDTGLVSQDHCACGRGLSGLAALEGKTWDRLRTPNGGTVPGVVVRHFLKDVPEVRQYQAQQIEYDRIVLRVVLLRPLCNESREFLISEFRRAFGSELRLEIEEVSEVPRSISGKQRCVIGLPPDKLRSGQITQHA